MSRPSAIWIVLWVVLALLGLTLWKVLKGPGENQVRAASAGTGEPQAGVGGSASTGPEGKESVAGVDGAKRGMDLLKSLPAPQSPPARLGPPAQKRWLKDLKALVDDASYLEDEGSLRMLIVEFRNPDAVIAEAARASLMARADKRALPYLLEMQSLDLKAGKKRELEELIEFLNKQSVFEHMRSKDL